MIDLPQVTLVALTGIGYRSKETIHALEYSQREIKFGAVKYIQLGSVTDIDSWNKAIVYDLWKYVGTGYCLLIHENGFVVNPQSWDPEWLKYDYIGAPWPLSDDGYSYKTTSGEAIRVGNSVSLRSQRILRLPTEMGIEWRSFYGNTHEDGFLCVHNRKELKSRGVVYAPIEVAAQFSRELEVPENREVDKPFCFHYNKFNPGRNEEYFHLIES